MIKRSILILVAVASPVVSYGVYQANDKSYLKRSATVKRHFKQQTICPTTGTYTQKCVGYVVDHIIPLKCHGKDAIENLQYQTVQEAKVKDKYEIRGDKTHKPCMGYVR
jgi:5-methylcytosine-specific restriction endonuclease McrA